MPSKATLKQALHAIDREIRAARFDRAPLLFGPQHREVFRGKALRVHKVAVLEEHRFDAVPALFAEFADVGPVLYSRRRPRQSASETG